MSGKLNKSEKLHNVKFLLKLLACAVNETQPPAVEDNIDFDYIFQFAELHKVANTAFYAIEKQNVTPPQDLLKKWEQVRNKNVHKNLIQAMEFSAITKAFTENQIAFMPFKGLQICNLYPSAEYRAMSDLDILIKQDIKKAVNIAMSMGYSHNQQDTTYEFKLTKPPFMLLELHTDLVSVNCEFYEYYKDIFSRCNSDSFEHKMSNEDFYIYNLVHLYKHYSGSGCGLRNIMDMYVINKKLLPQLNKKYIKQELKKLNLTEFHEEINHIADKWFSGKTFNDFSQQELYILSSGAYGTKENLIANTRKGKSKIAYVFYRLFPPLKWMQGFYKPLIKYPFLLPFFHIYRLFKAVFFKNHKISHEIRNLDK